MRIFTPAPARAALAACLLAALAGCGYSVRPPFNKGIKTVYVPILRSFSFRKDLNLQMTERLQKEIERRTPYKVVGSPENADAVLEGVINYADKNIQVESPYNLPRHLNALLTVEVKFYDNRPGAPAPPAQGVIVSESAPFYPELGETSMVAYQKVMDKLIAQIVGMMEEPWQ
jgi:Lipopolysaccharide-assembly